MLRYFFYGCLIVLIRRLRKSLDSILQRFYRVIDGGIFSGISLVAAQKMTTENIVGIVAGVLTGIAALPQLIKLVKEKDGKQLSPAMLLVLICGLSSWVLYGILKEDWPVIVTNAFSATVNLCILILRGVYSRRG